MRGPGARLVGAEPGFRVPGDGGWIRGSGRIVRVERREVDREEGIERGE